MVLAFVQNSLGLAGVTPEEQQIVTGAVLIVTLTVFGAYGYIRTKTAGRWRTLPAQRQADQPTTMIS